MVKDNPVLLSCQHLRRCEESGIVKVNSGDSVGCSSSGPCHLITRVGFLAESNFSIGVMPSPMIRCKLAAKREIRTVNKI